MTILPENAVGQIPEWVHWIAQDRDGAWWGFEVEPNEGAESWYENEVGRYIRLGKGGPNPDWRQALYCKNGNWNRQGAKDVKKNAKI